MRPKCDFGGWATRNDVLCSDGRVIRQNAFRHNDGRKVPLLWNHDHSDPFNVLGHALLENRNEGVYAYCYFNDSDAGRAAKLDVEHGDITALSIYANQLKQNGSDVIHGEIREVSLVYAGANPKAFIDTLGFEHSDDSDFEAMIFTGLELEHSVEASEESKEEDSGKEEKTKESSSENLSHSEEEKEEKDSKSTEKTVGDVIDTMTEEQKEVTLGLIGKALKLSDGNKEEKPEEKKEEPKETKDEGEKEMKHNAFDDAAETKAVDNVLTHSDMAEIINNAKRTGSLKGAFDDFCLEHSIVDHNGNTIDYGVANIDYLFPDAKKVSNTPDWIKREDAWVSSVMSGVHRTPFSRIKSIHADITGEDARALGYVKGNLKKEEVFELLKRETTPQTIYKKQQLDRDDIIDITDFDVVAWIKGEMRIMLDEEIARAILVGDQRSSASSDKINPLNIRPIWTDSDLYTVKKKVTFASTDDEGARAKALIKAVIRSRKEYKGSGNPVFYTTEDALTEMLLIEDVNGRVIYDTEEKLRTALRVSKIITVPVMENLTRTVVTDDGSETRTLQGIYVNLNDYNVGADKGGAVSLFDDFDIDYNRQKYLIETRCSGALIKPYSAVVIESVEASE